MADSKISALTELTSVASGDLLPIVDISDTSMAASGTTKKITQGNLVPDASDTVKGKVELATTAETTTGTDATRAVTPDGLHDMTSLSGAAWMLDEDDMASDSDTKTVSQQSVKAHVASGTITMTNKTLTSPVITTPTIKTWTGWNTVTDSWSYASADSPTFVITVPSGAASLYGVGWKVQLTQTTAKYFIITAITDTTLTVYGGTDYTLANAAISAIYVSPMKAPLGFPLDPLKWTVTVTDTTQRTAAGTASTWLNVGTTNSQIAIPIGVWDVSYQVNAVQDRTTQGTGSSIKVALSDANNTASNLALVSYHRYESGAANSSDINGITMARSKTLTLSVKATYYLNMVSDASGNWTYENALGNSLIEARCSYL